MIAKLPLSVSHPELAKQAVGWDPSLPQSNQNTKKTWCCSLGHVWESRISHRINGSGCPFCSSKKLLPGFNDLAFLNPTLAAESDQWDASTLMPNSNIKKKWKCELGHSWEAAVANRSSGGGCPFCAGKKVLLGFNDLLTLEPSLAKEALGWDPASTTRNSGKRKQWKCQLGHQWNATVGSRTSGRGCPVCAGKSVLAGFNDLATVLPELAHEAFGWDATTVTHGVGSKRTWKCKLGHIWEERVDNRASGNGCPICSGQKVLAGFNDLATIYPELSKEAFGWDPKTVTPGTEARQEWVCALGHRWKATVNSRSAGRGCPTCAKSGFDPNKDAWLYFLNHFEWGSLQIGITNSPDTRLPKHHSKGWELIELRGPMDGLIAREWETSILQMLKRHGAKLASEEVAGKFDGYTEAWITESFKVSSLGELMDAVRRDEDSR